MANSDLIDTEMSEPENQANGHNEKEAKKKRPRRKGSKKRKKLEATNNFVTITPPTVKTQEDRNVFVSFFTKQQRYAVSRAAISVSDDVNPAEFNRLLSTMLKQSNLVGAAPEFDFLVDGVMLLGKLGYRLNNSATLSREGPISIEYLEQLPPPIPRDRLNHDDWVSCLHYSTTKWLLTGCYDNTIHIWSPSVVMGVVGKADNLADDKTAHKLKIPDAHRAPVHGVSWIPRTDHRFISVSMDQSARLWHWDSTSNIVRCVYKCRGHTDWVDSLAVAADGGLFATGSGDRTIKIWSTDEQGVTDAITDQDDSSVTKKKKHDTDAPKTKVPRVTLTEHSQSVSGLVWPTLTTLASCSTDNSVRIWDVEAQKKKLQYVAPCCCVAIDSSPFNNTLLVTTNDFLVRLLDPRDKEFLSLTKTYKHHKRWANAVKWSPSNENHFATGGFDNMVKVWDIRSPSAPIWDLASHEDKVMALDWSRPGFLFSGSADTNVKMFTLR